MRIAAAIFVLALVVRLGVEVETGSLYRAPVGDEVEFTEIAENLLGGVGFSRNGSDPTAQRLPGYPLWLASVFALVGPSVVAARIANLALSALVPVLVFSLGQRLFGKRVGAVAGALAIVHVPFVENGAALMADTAFTLLSALVLLAAGDARSPWGWRRAACVGAGVGVAALFRAEILLFGVVLLLFWAVVVRDLRRFIVLSMAFAIPLAMVVAPWVARNYFHFGRFQMATVGHVLVGIYNETMFASDEKMGGWEPEPRTLRNAAAWPADKRSAANTYLPEPDWDRELTRQAMASIGENRARLPKMTVYKLYTLVFDVGKARALIRAPLVYFFLFGVACAVASRQTRAVGFELLFVGYTVVVTMILYVNARLRMSMDVPFLVLAAYGLCEQAAFLRRRHGSARTKDATLPFSADDR